MHVSVEVTNHSCGPAVCFRRVLGVEPTMAESVEIGDRRASGQDEVALAHAQVAAAKAEVAAAKAEVAAAKADVAEAETKFKDALAEWSATPLEDDHVRSVLWFQVMIAQEAVKTALEAVQTAQTHLKSCIERADRLATSRQQQNAGR